MKILTKQLNIAATLCVAAVLVFTTSCTKDNENPGAAPQKSEIKAVKDKKLQENIQTTADKMPPIAWYNKTMDKVIVFDPQNKSKSFDFSDPNSGWNFSNDQGVHFVENPSGGGVLFVSYGAFGSNTGSGTVVAGNTALNINYTFCFSVDEEALGLDLGFGDADFDGMSGVLGISGDFEALMNGNFEDTADIFDYFHGLAYYLVYDNEAQGNYEIINFIEDMESAEEEEGKGFSVVYGFTSNSFALYFSKDGTLNVSGGSMDFSGNYYGIVFENLMEADEEGDLFNFDFVEVPGFGQMGCS